MLNETIMFSTFVFVSICFAEGLKKDAPNYFGAAEQTAIIGFVLFLIQVGKYLINTK